MIGASQQVATASRQAALPPAPRWEWAVTGAFVGGALCSGVLQWPLSSEWAWVALWFLADVVTGAVASALVVLHWAHDAAGEGSAPPPAWRLPYARSGCPSERLVRVGQLLAQEWADAGQQVLFGMLAIAAALPLALALPDAQLGAVWLFALLLIATIGLAVGSPAVPLIVGLRAFIAWLLGYAHIGSLTVSLVVIAGLVGGGLGAVYLVEQGRPCLARWSGRAAAWGLAVWSALAQQPFLVAWVAAAALYWEAAARLGRGPALYAWRLGWLTIMLLVAMAFRLGTAPT